MKLTLTLNQQSYALEREDKIVTFLSSMKQLLEALDAFGCETITCEIEAHLPSGDDE